MMIHRFTDVRSKHRISIQCILISFSVYFFIYITTIPIWEICLRKLTTITSGKIFCQRPENYATFYRLCCTNKTRLITKVNFWMGDWTLACVFPQFWDFLFGQIHATSKNLETFTRSKSPEFVFWSKVLLTVYFHLVEHLSWINMYPFAHP